MNLAVIPNIITVARIFLVPPVVWAMLQGDFVLALLLFGVAGLSDAVDGLLARHYNWQSWLGSVLDPVADKLLQAASYITLAVLAHIPLWLVIAVVARDIIILTGSTVYYIRYHHFEANPSLLSKLNTVLQILYVLLVIVSIGVHAMPAWLIMSLAIVMFITTVTSGVHYVFRWVMLARLEEHK